MKKRILTLIGVILSIVLLAAGCGKTANTSSESTAAAQTFSKDKPVTLKVLADQVPHAELLEFVKPKLAEQGVTLK